MMGFLNNLQFTDLIDILVINFLIYAALIWFRQTSARFVIIGISILGLVYIVAKYLGLYLTTAIFQAFFAVFFIAIVIIFQEELRHFFEKVALWSTWRGRRKLGSKHAVIETLIRTITSLSQKRVGALIVLRGLDPLDRHLEGGTDLQGEPSEPLLESLFDPHSLGHDGAVIIDNNLIETFGVHLPLSKDLRQISNFGTRHTAALGLAERCDAMCVVVSEERGSISVTREGKIHSGISITQLNNMIERFYNEKFPLHGQKVGTSWLTSNLKEKIFAVFLACAIWWVFGQRTETLRRDFIVPVEYRNLSPMLTLEEPKTKEVVVTLSGLERAFSLLDPRSLKVSLDTVQIKPGWQMFLVTREDVRLPTNLTLERIEPSVLRLNVTELITLKVPIQVQTMGKLKESFVLDRLEVKPSEVEVIASPKLRDSAIKIFTEPIDLNAISESTSFNPRLIVPTAIRFKNGKDPEVKVKIKVKKIEAPKPQNEEKNEVNKEDEEKEVPSFLIKEDVKMTPIDQKMDIRK